MTMTDIANDTELIYDAAVLAGILSHGEIMSNPTTKECALLLREMRAETECIRLAERIRRHFLSNRAPGGAALSGSLSGCSYQGALKG